MFDIAWAEILVLLVLAILVVGPKDMPKLVYGAAKILSYVRVHINDARGKLDTLMRQAVIDEVREAEKDLSNVASEVQDLANIRKGSRRTYETSRHAIKAEMEAKLEEERAARLASQDAAAGPSDPGEAAPVAEPLRSSGDRAGRSS
ncbi:MAG: hypothetical protein ACFB22_00135 [Rhodothalassiaceae bacterium]